MDTRTGKIILTESQALQRIQELALSMQIEQERRDNPLNIEPVTASMVKEKYIRQAEKIIKPMKLVPTETQLNRTPPKVGRNEPCPCGSGIKFKKCCLRVEVAK